MAMPFWLVVTVVEAARVTPGPLAGAENVTEASGIGLPSTSRTTAATGAAKAVPTWVVCPSPAEMAMETADPAVIWNELLMVVRPLAAACKL